METTHQNTCNLHCVWSVDGWTEKFKLTVFLDWRKWCFVTVCFCKIYYFCIYCSATNQTWLNHNGKKCKINYYSSLWFIIFYLIGFLSQHNDKHFKKNLWLSYLHFSWIRITSNCHPSALCPVFPSSLNT